MNMQILHEAEKGDALGLSHCCFGVRCVAFFRDVIPVEPSCNSLLERESRRNGRKKVRKGVVAGPAGALRSQVLTGWNDAQRKGALCSFYCLMKPQMKGTR
ncbi:hypothetical protein, unlikely [Trypanosoma brucei gambiense DAL972]|uniref:Uncharacterized protein n=2 Tax=Trypanosoma brucei TaxID=5691 RepID=C9ZUD4_TRYB9|nr:hypothetical protein, unlikely [Trypanosoma brucei gambiense DAL972]RHW71722.1 hypothetical protein DPX39_070082600 [Trypanosoma brucei equiperdum]CBH13021.1 hypothetical protein, unlikely [Trypanosoma brucei gambiense DAL972]|eukprot:XP_011775299.1 hypothetical protein, unlikely [Trypanosoma brucei gambiense DAL972]